VRVSIDQIRLAGVRRDRASLLGLATDLARLAEEIESAEKRLSGKSYKVSRWLRALLVQAAHTAAREASCTCSLKRRRLIVVRLLSS